MDWFPVVFIIFKIVVLGIGMFFAIKWHYDQDKKAQKGEVLSTVGKMATILVISLFILLFITFTIANRIGIDLALS